MPATTSQLSFDIYATGADLHLQVILDGEIIWDGYPSAEIETVRHDFDDDTEREHELHFCMRGKRTEHTELDETGTIVKDRCIHIANMAFNQIKLGQIFNDITQYSHDHNGTTDASVDRFFGVMGCNGRVEMRFSTPIYLWLLENM